MQLNLLLSVAALLCALLLGALGGYRIEAGKLAELKLQYAQAETKAREEAASIQKAQDDISLNAALVEGSLQQAQAALTERAIDEVKTYVPPTVSFSTGGTGPRGCVTFGFVRVLDAAAIGVDPGTLQLPAGATNDTCAPVEADALARNIVANYGAAEANAEQLNRLELTILQLQSARSPGAPAPARQP